MSTNLAHTDGVPELLPSAMVADELGVSVSTVARMARRGDLKPAAKVGGLRGPYLFTRATIDAYKAAAS